jgi:hypothetical protein
MHEYQNRPTKGSSDCLGCARRPPVARRTREASSGWPSNGKAFLGGMVAHDGGRPSAANVVNPCGYRSETGCAAYDGRAHCHGAASWQPLPVHGSIVDETRNAEDRREVPGRVGRVGRVWGGRPEAGLRVLTRRCPIARGKPALRCRFVGAARIDNRQAGAVLATSMYYFSSRRRGMTTICALQTAGVDVERSLGIVARTLASLRRLRRHRGLPPVDRHFSRSAGDTRPQECHRFCLRFAPVPCDPPRRFAHAHTKSILVFGELAELRSRRAGGRRA